MNARIHTVEQYRFGNKGKKSRVAANSLAITPRSRRRANGNETRWLEIKATGTHEYGTGDRGGDWKVYTDTLILNLDAKDLEAILRAAIASKLVAETASEYLLGAQLNLEKAIAELGISEELAHSKGAGAK
jgi:hypothetical protein